MPSVDERIVEMRFDNKEFETNVNTSLGTLDKLKKALKLDGVTSGFENIDKASKKVSFDSLIVAAETVTQHFSAFGIIGDQVLRRIGDQVYQLEMRMVNLVKSMSIDQISAGWNKYAQKTESVQTIINATGKSIDEVNGYLDKLMWFSDETSYGFTDMTSAIGQMTSSGGDIEKLVPMVMGVANATAFAGKSASEFTRVMYNLNQSYGAGYLTYMDWRSLELAGVGSKQLKQTFIDIAKSLGKIKDGEVTIDNFGTTLSKKWADTEVMEKAFGYFGEMTEKAYELVNNGDFETASDAYEYLATQYDTVSLTAAKAAQEAKTFVEAIDATKDAVSSGWMKSFELIFGNYEEAKVLWTWLANSLWDVFASGAEERNDMLQMWHDGIDGVSGYSMAIEGLHNIFDGIVSILDGISSAWHDVFPSITAERLISFTESFRDATASFKDFWSDGDKSPSGIFKSFGNEAKTTSETLDETAESADNASKSIEEMAQAVISGQYGNGDDRKAAIEALGYSYASVQNKVNELLGCSYRLEEETTAIGEAADSTSESLEGVRDGMEGLSRPENMTAEEASISNLQNLQKIIHGIASAIRIVKDVATAAWKVFVKPLLGEIGKLFVPVLNLLGKVGDKFTSWGEKFDETYFVDKFTSIKESVSSFFDRVKELDSFKGLQDKFESLKETLSSAWETVKESFGKIKDAFKLPSSDKMLGFVDTILTFFDTVGDKLSPTWEWIKTAFGSASTKVTDFFKNLPETMPALFDQIKNLPAVQKLSNTWKKFTDALGKGSKKIPDKLTAITDKIKEFLPTKDELLNALDWIVDKFNIFVAWLIDKYNWVKEKLNSIDFSAIWESITSFFSGIKTRIFGGKEETVVDEIGNVTESIEQLGETTKKTGVFEFVSSIFNGFLNFIKNLNGTDIAIIAAAGVLVSLFFTIHRIMSFGLKMVQSITTLADTLNGSISKKRSTTKLESYAIAILMLVAALVILSFIEPEKLQNAIITLGIISGLLIVLALAMAGASKLAGGSDNAMKASGSIIMLAGALFIICTSLMLLSITDLTDIWKKLLVVGTVLAALVAVSIILTKFNKGAKIRSSVQLLILVGVLIVLAYALQRISGLDLGGVKTNLIAIIGILLILAIISRLSSKASFKSSAGLLIMCLNLYILAKVLEKLATVDLGKILAGLPTFLVILVLLSLMMLSSRLAGKNALKGGAGILLMSAALLIIARAMERIGEIPGEQLNNALKAVSAILALFAIITVVSKFSGKDSIKAGLMIVLMSAAVLLLASAMETIGNLSDDVFKKGLIAIETIIGMFAVLLVASHFAKSAVAVIIMIVVVLGGIIAAFKMLSKLNANKMMKQAKAISLIIGALTIMLAAVSLMKGGFKSNIGNVAVALVGLLGTIVVIVGALTLIGVIANAWSGFEASVKKGGKILTYISEELFPALIKFTALAGALSVIGAYTGYGVLIGIAGLTAVVLAMPLLMGALHGLVTLIGGGSTSWIDTASDTFDKIGTAIGSFFGSIVSAFVGQVIGDDMSSLTEGIVDFITAFDDIDSETVTSATNAATALGTLCGALPRDGGLLQAFIGSQHMDTFAEDLGALGKGIRAYYDALAKGGAMDTTIMDSATNSAKLIANLNNSLPRTGGALQDWIGQPSLSSFAWSLGCLGAGIRTYYNWISYGDGINADVLTDVTNSAQLLADLNGSLPNTGGALQDWIGQPSLSNFAWSLGCLGAGVRAYYNWISYGDGINADVLTDVTNSAQLLADLNGSLPNTGGALQDWIGQPSLSNFGQSLGWLGMGVRMYYNAINAGGGIDTTKLDNATASAQLLANLEDSLPSTGGKLTSWLFGEQSLSDFGTSLVGFGEGIAGYAEKISGLTETDISNMLKVGAIMQTFKSVSETATEVSDATSASQGVMNYGVTFTWETVIGQMGSVISGFYEAVSDVSWDVFTNAKDGMTDLADACSYIKDAGIEESDVTGFVDAIKKLKSLGGANGSISKILAGFGDETTNTGLTNLTSFATSIAGLSNFTTDDVNLNAYKSYGNSIIKAISSGMSGAQSLVTSTAIAISRSISNSFSNNTNTYSTGQYIITGLYNGMANNAYRVYEKAREIANNVTKIINKALKVESPSRVTMETGKYVSLGLALGMENYAGAVEKSASDVSNSAINMMTSAISTVSDICDGIAELDPTIRPVLDLSNVQNGINGIGSMFNTNAGVKLGNITANTASISKLMGSSAESTEDAFNRQVIIAINDIRGDINDLGDRMAQLKIMLDSGALVGGIIDPIDHELGIRTKLAERGI